MHQGARYGLRYRLVSRELGGQLQVVIEEKAGPSVGLGLGSGSMGCLGHRQGGGPSSIEGARLEPVWVQG